MLVVYGFVVMDPHTHTWHAACVPALDHVPVGQGKHSVLCVFANVPAVQLGQKDMVSEVDDVPALHLEQSCCERDARGMRNSYRAVTLPSRAVLILMK
jgi:hypothetical protein